MGKSRGGSRNPRPTPALPGLGAGLLIGLLAGLATPAETRAGEANAGAATRAPAGGFEHLLVEDGLSDVTVYSLLQDRSGFLWVGTENGLNRFDGYAFEVWRHDPNTASSLASNGISFMLQDARGKIWLATWGGGLDRFDPIAGSFEHFRADPAYRDRLHDDRIQHLLEDSRGGLWIGTFSGGLSRLDVPDTGSFVTYRHDPEDSSSLCHDRVWRVAEDASGALWVGTGKGLCLFDRVSETFERFVHRPGDPTSLSDDVVRALWVDSDGALWAGTGDGLNRFDRLSKTFERFPAGPEGLSHPVVTAVYQDSLGTLWVGTRGGGLNARDRASGTWRRYRHDPRNPSSLSDDDVRAILEDASGVLWIATRHGGLNKLDLKLAKFETVNPRAGPGAGPGSERVRALAEDDQGRLWIASAEGLSRQHVARSGFDRFRHDERDPASLPSNDVHRLLIDSSGTLWIGVGDGLYRFDAGTSSFLTHELERGGGTSAIDSDRVNHLFEDRSGNLWIGRRSGLDRLDRQRRRARRYRHLPSDPSSLSESFVTVTSEDSNGGLWVGTHNGGVNRLDLSDPAAGFQRFVHDPNDPQSLSNNRISAVHQQQDGSLWIGTVNGLNEMRSDGTFRRLLVEDGLPHPQIAAILDDGAGRLWLATGHGLARLDPAAGVFRNYAARDGLQSDRFYVGSALRRRDGRLCFGGSQGYSCFLPERVRDNPHAPPVVLTDFKKLGESVSFDRAAWSIGDIRLEHDENFFTFEFAALDFTRPEDNRYRYLLEGFDRDWTAAGTRRSASYTNVSPGDYVFRVQGSNSDQVWNREGLAVAVSIMPPFWQTTWFRALAVLALTTVVGGAYSARVQSLKRRESKMARRVEESLADLKRSDERYRLLFERNLAGVVRATLEGRVLDCNDAFARILGYASTEECRARHVIDFDAAPALADRLQDRGTIAGYESSAQTRDGGIVALLWNASLVRGEGDQSPVIEATVIDVSERRRIEEGLRRAQKLESLGMLAGGIAHDFNNLLMSIMGNAELARRDLEESSPVHPRLDRIETASQRAADLAQQMLAYSGQGDFVVAPLDLSAAVREMADLLAGAVSKKARLVYELEPELPAVEADAGQIEQIVMSLVTNASEALANAAGAITIRTGSRVLGPADLAATYLDDRLPAGRYVFLEVADQGCGMDEELQLKIFDPFFTTKFTGRGLGLAAVLGIVRGHRGAIQIDSAPGRGSTFTLSFPAAAPESITPVPKPPRAAPTPPARPPRQRSDPGTVLVVDDDENVRRVAQDMLRGMGFDVLTAVDGEEAVAVFGRRAGDIELVVLDLSMPRMGGEEAFREIRKIAPDARVILASGYDEQESTRRFAGQGLSGFIQKPYRLKNLDEKVREVLSGA